MSAMRWRDRLELADRLAELRARARVRDRRLQQPLHRADVAREEADPLPVHRRGEERRTPRRRVPSTASAGTYRSSNTSSPIGEVRRPIFSNFVPAEKPGVPRSTRNAVTPPWIALRRVGHREHDHDVGDRTVGDEGLGAVDAEAGAVALGARAQRERVGARVRARSSRARRSACRRTGRAGSAASAPRCRAARAARRRRAGARTGRTRGRRRGSRSRAPRARSRR